MNGRYKGSIKSNACDPIFQYDFDLNIERFKTG